MFFGSHWYPDDCGANESYSYTLLPPQSSFLAASSFLVSSALASAHGLPPSFTCIYMYVHICTHMRTCDTYIHACLYMYIYKTS